MGINEENVDGNGELNKKIIRNCKKKINQIRNQEIEKKQKKKLNERERETDIRREINMIVLNSELRPILDSVTRQRNIRTQPVSSQPDIPYRQRDGNHQNIINRRRKKVNLGMNN